MDSFFFLFFFELEIKSIGISLVISFHYFFGNMLFFEITFCFFFFFFLILESV